MRSKLQKWGNSQGLRFVKHILEKAHLSIGDPVEIIAQNGMITIKTMRKKTRGKYRLKDLIAQMPKEYRPKEEDWGSPVGKEVW
jgi:antitoxin MazE